MSKLLIRELGTQEYSLTLARMREFTNKRDVETTDEFWCLQHPAVFTLGANADEKHILRHSNIPIVQSDRGGQVTYHGPGQIIVYLLVDLRRKNFGVKQFVQGIEQAVVALLDSYSIESEARAEAHGVYVNSAKIASLGLRVYKGCSYHGVALNVDMDLTPFTYINPCGFSDLEVTQLKNYEVELDFEQIQKDLFLQLCTHLQYKPTEVKTFG